MSYAIIVGGGKIGYYLARSLINRDYEVCLMEKNSINAHRLRADLGDVVMQADGCDPLVLQNAGVLRADLVFAATGDDPDNLVVCQMARTCFGRQRIIARVNNPDNESLFEKLGVHERVSGTAAVLSLISQKVGKSPVILLGALERSSLEVVEIVVEDDSPFCGARLADIQLPPKCLVISSIREGEAHVPTGDTTFQSGDVMIILVPAELESTLREFSV